VLDFHEAAIDKILQILPVFIKWHFILWRLFDLISVQHKMHITIVLIAHLATVATTTEVSMGITISMATLSTWSILMTKCGTRVSDERR
jgi:hypothetical protein